MTMFRDFLRHFPRARVEDYYKDGRWMMEQLEVDLALVAHHRREAGAPDPEPLEDVPMPELPRGSDYSRGAPPNPPPAAGRYDSRAARGPKQPAAPPSAAARAAQQGVPSVAPDARAVSDFISKWKLEQSRAKLLLARLAPSRRRDVMDNFKATSKDISPTAELEKYIATRVPMATTSGVGSAAKRPLSSPGASKEPPSKRLRETPAIGASVAPRSGPPPSSARPAASAPLRPIRSPLPSRGAPGGGSRSTPPPWRDAGGPPPPSSGARRATSAGPAARAEEGIGRPSKPPPLPRRAPAAGSGEGGPATRPTARPTSVLGASGAKESAKPGDLIKSLLG